jgi:hypothetical protein
MKQLIVILEAPSYPGEDFVPSRVADLTLLPSVLSDTITEPLLY